MIGTSITYGLKHMKLDMLTLVSVIAGAMVHGAFLYVAAVFGALMLVTEISVGGSYGYLCHKALVKRKRDSDALLAGLESMLAEDDEQDSEQDEKK